MRMFRCYLIGLNGKATDSLSIEASTAQGAADEAAIRFAERPHLSIEVWHGPTCELTARNAQIPAAALSPQPAQRLASSAGPRPD